VRDGGKRGGFFLRKWTGLMRDRKGAGGEELNRSGLEARSDV
jgi:hypothetical protein